jgi:hypothetical protein
MEQERRLLREENAVLKWDAAHKAGTRVRFWTGPREGEGKTGIAYTEAQLMASGTAVVYIRDDNGKNIGCVSLTHVEPLAEAKAGVTHPTIGKYLRGFDIPLSKALMLRDLFAPDKSLDDLWKPRH